MIAFGRWLRQETETSSSTYISASVLSTDLAHPRLVMKT